MLPEHERALHERALHGVVVLEAQGLAGVELLAVERELHARLARLLEVARGQHEAHLALGDECGGHALLHAAHAHADADLAGLHEAAAEHAYRSAALDGPRRRPQLGDARRLGGTTMGGIMGSIMVGIMVGIMVVTTLDGAVRVRGS